MKIELEKQLEVYQDRYNSSKAESLRLHALCDGDFYKLTQTYLRLKPVYGFGVPDTKEQLNVLLSKPLVLTTITKINLK